ncbi:MAG: TIGR00282 family metallophosphoesterase [Proteobacteria bacterium]|nr:TIGR00282 family metallophosphoesterase [Pseudomonadota bacterium]
MIGDIAGKPGMRTTRSLLPRIVAEKQVDFVVANGENTARGVGITPDLSKDMLDMGVNCITTGNHVWRHREIRDYIEFEPRLLRPYNFPKNQPGAGFGVFETAAGVKIGVINLAGRVYMDPADNPFTAADAALETMPDVQHKFVDFHAEATSEKRAMGFYLDGRVTAVLGTHTHIQTADQQVLDGGTAYITDIGMTGPHDSVIGMRKDLILDRFVNGMPHSFKLSAHGSRLQAVIIQSDRKTGQATSIERIDLPAI